MRVAVVILVVLGLVAALCAVLLLQVVATPGRGRAASTSDPELDVLTAVAAMPAMTVVDGKAIATKKVRRSLVPQAALLSTVQVVGKILTRPMVEGEAFTESCFATEGIGLHLAAALPAGKRAVSVQFRDHTAMAGLLYPGSVVDVLVSVQPAGKEVSREAVATTLLQGVQVLAIGSQSVTSAQEFKDKNPGALNTKGQQMNTRMVTLLVTPKQAEVLQLATQYGYVALTMRNPLDTSPVAQELTRISEFTTNGSNRAGTNLLTAATEFFKARVAATPASRPAAVASSDPFQSDVDEAAQEKNPLWEMLIIRGSAEEKRQFPMPEAGQMRRGMAGTEGPRAGAFEPVTGAN